MQVEKADIQVKGVVSHQESCSQQSSQSQSNREVGNTKISEKSANFQSEQTSQTVQQSKTGTMSSVMQTSFTSSKDNKSKQIDDNLLGLKEDVPCVYKLKKTFEEQPLTTPVNENKAKIDIGAKAITHSSSSKALEIINKYIDVPEPKAEPIVEPETANKATEEIYKENSGKETGKLDFIDAEMKKLSKELEELKQEEERCRKTYVTRETSTSSLEEAFVQRLQERHYKNIQEMLSDNLPINLFKKAKRPESLPPGNLVHLIQSVQIAQELNSIIKQPREVDKNLLEVTNKDESSGPDNKPIDLEKLFTPATDSGEVTPSRNRKMYASSSFYSPFHPTVQDQVELARRISSSLCDISNKQSKGQSMYVNRMKRSVKWVHGGEEHSEIQENTYTNDDLANYKFSSPGSRHEKPKNILKLVMNPHGKVQDIHSLTKQGLVIQPPLSPELCFDLVKDLNTTKGKGAELFAKRRKKSEKWVVDENTVKQSNPAAGVTPMRQTSQSNAEKAMSQSCMQRDQQMKKIHELKERIGQPKVKLVKSPWEAALETGSVDTAFQEMKPALPQPPITWTAKIRGNATKPFDINKSDEVKFGNHKSHLYMPNIPKAWASPAHDDASYGLPEMSTSLPITTVTDFSTDFSRKNPSYAKNWDFTSWNNYNTAPRGWKQDLDYYRPVTFTPSYKLSENTYYRDY